mmetsp:Transcript_70199/g.183988  ORF Transcript_70199/g.183988 Transcript_70199/m.183988 type:complete len:304 (-) Transcript_70199:116-1027(-)
MAGLGQRPEGGGPGRLHEIDQDDLELNGTIGEGTTAIVYLGHYNGGKVAVKELRSNETDGKTNVANLQALQRELSVLSISNHPSILHCVGVIAQMPPVRVVLEYCAGGSLFDLLHGRKQVRLSWAQRLKILKDTALAVAYLHSFDPPIMHRDLKSLNIMLMQALTNEFMVPQTRLADFGFARMREIGVMTQGVGTKHWMAPEVSSTADYTEKADVFSFAMVIYEVACRRIPFETDSPDQVAAKVTSGERPSFEPHLRPSDAPEGLIPLAHQCWDMDPAKRPSFEEVVSGFRRISAATCETFNL